MMKKLLYLFYFITILMYFIGTIGALFIGERILIVALIGIVLAISAMSISFLYDWYYNKIP